MPPMWVEVTVTVTGNTVYPARQQTVIVTSADQ